MKFRLLAAALLAAAFMLVFPSSPARAAAITTGAGPTPAVTILTATNAQGASLTISQNRGRRTISVSGYAGVPQRKLRSDLYRVTVQTSDSQGANGFLVGEFVTIGSTFAMNFPATVYMPSKGQTIKVTIAIGQHGPGGGGFYEDVARPASISSLTVN